MDTPASFWKMAMRFHQDVPSFVEATEAALADYLVRGLVPLERQELADFLDAEFALPDAGNRILRLWNKSQADFRFAHAREIGEFFKVIRSRL